MKELFKDIRNDKTTNIGFLTTVIVIIVTFILTLFFYGRLPPFVPVFNQLPWGEERLGETLTIFVPILTSSLIFILNLITSTLIYKKIPLVSRMLAGTSLLIAALTFLFVIKTIILIL
ncbi:MAG: hypothetical protein AAB583_01380 [Patescibacteria group bacterium]